MNDKKDINEYQNGFDTMIKRKKNNFFFFQQHIFLSKTLT